MTNPMFKYGYCQMCGGPLTKPKPDVENPDRLFHYCTECGRAHYKE